MSKVTLVMVLSVVMASPALAAGNGMYLCPSPVIANGLWSDISEVIELKLPVKEDSLQRLGEKNRCKLVLSPDLKPIDFVAGALLITDGIVKGWAEPHLYIRYINGGNS